MIAGRTAGKRWLPGRVHRVGDLQSPFARSDCFDDGGVVQVLDMAVGRGSAGVTKLGLDDVVASLRRPTQKRGYDAGREHELASMPALRASRGSSVRT